MSDGELRSELKGIDEALRKLDASESKVITLTQKAFNLTAYKVVSWMRAEKLTGGPADDKLHVGTGRLRASIRPIPATVENGTVTAGIQSGSKYARVQINKRGTVTEIKPVNAQALVIPLKDAKNPTGVAKGGPRDEGLWGKTVIIPVKRHEGDRAVIYGVKKFQRGKNAGQFNDKLVPLFLLIKKVKVKARVAVEEIFDKARTELQTVINGL